MQAKGRNPGLVNEMPLAPGQTSRCQESDDGVADNPGFRYAASGLRSLRDESAHPPSTTSYVQ